jgi:hypothetical protein
LHISAQSLSGQTLVFAFELLDRIKVAGKALAPFGCAQS